MLLAIDIGNTNITLGIFKGNRIIRKFNIPTQEVIHSRRGRLNVPYGKLIRIFREYKIDDAVICSVVPKSRAVLEKDLNKLLRKRPIIIGKDILVPIKNLYRQPKQVGQDRLVNAYAAVLLFGAPLIVVDFGTAITFDVISKNREYLGGMILPGLQVSLDALGEKTALLPKVKLSSPKEFIARDTKNSMLSGIVYGFAALTDELIKRIRDRIEENATVIGTGGNIGLIGKYCNSIAKTDVNLTLKGLSLIYQQLT